MSDNFFTSYHVKRMKGGHAIPSIDLLQYEAEIRTGFCPKCGAVGVDINFEIIEDTVIQTPHCTICHDPVEPPFTMVKVYIPSNSEHLVLKGILY